MSIFLIKISPFILNKIKEIKKDKNAMDIKINGVIIATSIDGELNFEILAG
tara:strand:+ start:615 stop:767 length:153 start_codon:yes stop_codon:yes gene_type:complete